MTVELIVFSDYEQIYLLDSESSTELADHWLDSELIDYLALAEDGVGIRTGFNGDVAVGIEVIGGPPDGDLEGFDTVTECSLRADSGLLRLTSPTYGLEDGDLVAVPRGWLRLRVSLTRSPDDETPEWSDEYPEDPAARQHIRVQCWSSEQGGAVLLKGWNPQTGSFHPAPVD
ncbi:hypothetical protein [Nocardia crassostreae]|uniref:hypothetical protein n=1 Tax=Nocardia crassostreae TaxID=53428 RepID=UPI0012F9D041|nr:hypothetical protein [Nocardia crassostreae]